MLPANPKAHKLELLSIYQHTQLDDNKIPLPSFNAAFPNNFGSSKTYDSCLSTDSNIRLNNKYAEGLTIKRHSDSGKISTILTTAQQQVTITKATTRKKNLKVFICQYCGREISSKRNLLSHESIHENVKPFSCSTCGKEFRLRQHLKEHMSIHTNTRPYQCSDWGKSFRHRSVLHFHKTVHNDNLLPHKCSICFKEFRIRVHLISHLYIHDTLKPYRCNCGKGFTKKWNLTRHLRNKMSIGHVAASDKSM